MALTAVDTPTIIEIKHLDLKRIKENQIKKSGSKCIEVEMDQQNFICLAISW